MEEFKPEYVALVGILLGWVLSTFSATLKYRNERKADLSRAVSRLLPELANIEILRSATEGFKDTCANWAEFEGVRCRMWQRHGQFFLNDATTDWNEIVDQIAKHKPILAIKVRGQIHLAKKLATNKLPGATSSSPEGYVKLLSMSEVAHIAVIKELRQTIRRISWAAGFSLGIAFERHMLGRGGGSKRRRENADFIRSFQADLWDDLRPELRQKSDEK